MNNKSFDLQNKVRLNAMQVHESIKSLKKFEAEMKIKDQEIQKEMEKEKTPCDTCQEPPIRSNLEEFQMFQAELQKINTLSIKEDNKTFEEQNDIAARKQEAAEFKDKGNKFVKAKEYESAIKMYTRAIELCDDDPVYYSNRSQCYLTLEKYKECIDDASKAIELDQNCSKAYFRRMTAYEKLGDDFKALKSCRKCLDLVPEDQICKNAYDRIHNRIMAAEKKKDKEKIRWSRLRSSAQVTNFVTKPPHLRSKRPMKSVPVRLRKAASPIPEALLDKIFGNTTGENTPEPETDSKLFKPNFLFTSPVSGSPPKVVKIEEPPKFSVKIVEAKKKIDESNKILKASGTDKELKLEDLESQNLNALPRSGPQFYATWKELEEIPRFLYLKNLADNGVPVGKLLGAQLTSDMLSEIIYIVHEYFPLHKIPHIQLLSDLSKNTELSLLSMFLEADEKKKLNKLLKPSMAGGDSNLIHDIKERFQI